MKHIGEIVREAVADLEPDEWVNAELTLVLPLDVAVDASDEDKREALSDLHDLLLDSLPSEFEGCVSSARFEDAQHLGIDNPIEEAA